MNHHPKKNDSQLLQLLLVALSFFLLVCSSKGETYTLLQGGFCSGGGINFNNASNSTAAREWWEDRVFSLLGVTIDASQLEDGDDTYDGYCFNRYLTTDADGTVPTLTRIGYYYVCFNVTNTEAPSANCFCAASYNRQACSRCSVCDPTALPYPDTAPRGSNINADCSNVMPIGLASNKTEEDNDDDTYTCTIDCGVASGDSDNQIPPLKVTGCGVTEQATPPNRTDDDDDDDKDNTSDAVSTKMRFNDRHDAARMILSVRCLFLLPTALFLLTSGGMDTLSFFF